MHGWKGRIGGVLWIAAIVAATALVAPSSGAQTLEETLARTYMTNPSLLGARAQLRATDETVAQALSGWRPTVRLNADAGKRLVDQRGQARSEWRTPRGASLTIGQNLFNGFGTQAVVQQSEFAVQADRARLVATEQSVLLDAVTAYMDVLRDQAVLDLNVNNERVLRRQLEATQDRFEVGEVTRTDVAQAESRVSRASADRIRAEGDLVNSRARYRAVVGDAPGTLQRPQPVGGGLPVNEDEAHALARDRAPAVHVARFEEQAAQERVNVVSSDLWPSVDLQGSLSRSDEATSRTSRTESAAIIATMSVPLYEAGAVSARVREAKEVVGQRRQELDRAVRLAIEDATRAWETLLTARAQIKAFTEEVRAAEIALEGVQQEAAVGSRTTLDVLDAEQELLDARVNLVRAERDELVASFALRAAIGAMTARELALPVQIYDYDSHYRETRGRWWGTDIGR
jgi:TolC family type I secretion outer membrane protein